MAQGNGSEDERRVRGALDVCLDRMRRGESLDRCLADYPTLADALRPLLETVAAIAAERVVPPPAPTGLASGRARFLDAAAALRAEADAASENATAAGADVSAGMALDEALDACLGRVRAGEPMEGCLRDFGALAGALRPLVEMALAVEAERVTPPAAALSAGRARLLEAAAGARAVETKGLAAAPGLAPAPRGARAAAPAPGRVDRLVAWLLPAGGLSTARLAGAALGLVAFLGMGNLALAPVAAGSLPGQPLYGVKVMNERLLLALTLDPEARQALVASFSHERAEEAAAVAAMGGEEEIDWPVRLKAVEEDTDNEPPARFLHVMTLEGLDLPAEPRLIAFDEGTAYDLAGLYESIHDVPSGSLIEVRTRIRREAPKFLALHVRLLAAMQPDPTVTPTLGATETPPEPTPVDPTGTATTAPPTATATATDLPPTATSTPVPTGTATDAPSPTPVPEIDDERDLLFGSVEAMDPITASESTTWTIADFGQSNTLVTAEVKALGEHRAEAQVGDRVELHGRWQGRERRRFIAKVLYMVARAECTMQDATFTVLDFKPGSSLVLEGNLEFSLANVAREVVPRDLKPGDLVHIRYQQCGNRRVLVELTVQGPAQPGQGEVVGAVSGDVTVAGGGFFDLVDDQGRTWRVTYDPATTPITGAAAIRVGQSLNVDGFVNEGTSAIRATAIEVLFDPPPSPTPAAGLAAPTAAPPLPTGALPPSGSS